MGDPHDSARWKKPGGISDQVRRHNPICQFVDPENNRQCTRPAEVVHHLRDWKDVPDLFFVWANLVAVCAEHHSGGQRGDTQHYIYVHTLGPLSTIYPHGHGMPQWHKDYIKPLQPLLPKGSTASVVGDDVLDRALAEPL